MSLGRIVAAGTAAAVLIFLGVILGARSLPTKQHVPPQPDLAPPHEATVFPATNIPFGAVRQPQFVSAAEASIDKGELIVGLVEPDGEARAYVLSALAAQPSRHVVLDEIAGKHIAVTHCPRTGVTRVFTSGEGDAPLSVECSGWLEQQDMALLVDGQVYGHSSPHIPLEEVACCITTWENWRHDQPDSLVYVGGAPPARDRSEAN